MKLFGALIAAGLLVAPRVQAQTHTDFSGVWVLDTTSIVNDPVLKALKMTIQQGRDTLRVVSEVTDQRTLSGPRSQTTLDSRYGFDDKSWLNDGGFGAPTSTILSWDGSTLVLTMTGTLPNGLTLNSLTRLTLDRTGTTLTRLQRVRAGERVNEQTLLFRKR